ncbi:MAG: hypothetical protein M1836_007495 [Candelina mexicana]|nr:MAG: hypothetical protein M1836_007495 [Candelina mexicana]
MSSSASVGLGIPVPKMLPITGTWTLPFAAYFALLANRVVYHRLKNEKYLGDKISSSPSSSSSSPNSTDPLYIATRSHANFVENVPLAFLFTAVAELNGGNRKWINYAMAGLLMFRVAHVELGLTRENALGGGRPISYYGTQAFLGGMAAYGTWLCRGYWGF